MVAWPVRAPRGSPHPADRNFYSRATWLESRGPSTWRMPSTIGVAWHVTRTECHSENHGLQRPSALLFNRRRPYSSYLCEDIRSQQSVSRVFLYACTNKGGGFFFSPFHFIICTYEFEIFVVFLEFFINSSLNRFLAKEIFCIIVSKLYYLLKTRHPSYKVKNIRSVSSHVSFSETRKWYKYKLRQ